LGSWRDRALTAAVLAATIAAFTTLVFHAWPGFRGAYLAHTSGVWLSAAQDLNDGVLYRAISSDLGYGGTRYFPLFFAILATVQRAGASVLTASWIAAGLSLATLGFGMRQAALTLGVSRAGAWLFAGAAIAPYFAQETAFEVRADVLAAGLNFAGLAYGLRLWRDDEASTRRVIAVAALFFSLAFATKVTSLWAPAALVAAGLFSRRRAHAALLGAFVALGVALFFVIVTLASQGRAMDAWASVMYGGRTFRSTVDTLTSGGFIPGLTYSRTVLVFGVLGVVALTAGAMSRKRALASGNVPLWPVAAVFAAASITTAFILSSPGTVLANQVTEWISSVWLILAALSARRSALERPALSVVATLVLWMSAQDLSHANKSIHRLTTDVRAARAALISRVERASGSVLSDSALWPALARRSVVVPDAFAFRIAAISRPELENDLIARIARREFPFVILEFDPLSPEGKRMYGFAHLTPAVVDAIMEHYRFESAPLENALIYLPK